MDLEIRIVKNGVPTGIDHSNMIPWVGTLPEITYGGDTDLWGETWTAADINDPGFGVSIRAQNTALGAQARVDSIAVRIYYELNNLSPTADAGPNQSIRVGDPVFLDGSSSFDDNTPNSNLVFNWVLIAPPGSNSFLSNPGATNPTFLVDTAGTYEARLSVTDEEGLMSEFDSVLISTDNLAPTSVIETDCALLCIVRDNLRQRRHF